MKILILTPNLHCGGAEKVLYLLSGQWSKNNDVAFCLFDTSNQFFPVNIKIHDLKSENNNNFFLKFYNYFKRVYGFQKLLKKTRPDLIISFTESANYVSILSCILVNKRKSLIISVRTNLNHYSLLTKISVRLLYNFSNKVVVPSIGLKYLLNRIGISKKKINVIHNPVILHSKKNNTLKRQIKSKPYILAVGRLSKEKGFEILIECFSKIDKDAELIFIGEGPEKNKLINLSLSLGLKSRVKFLGFIKKLDEWYLNARFLALTSYFEGWPNVILEAMSLNCPVISFNCNFGPKEIITNNVNGILVEQGNKKALIKQMLRLLNDDKLHSKLSKNASERAKDFELNKISNQWTDLISK